MNSFSRRWNFWGPGFLFLLAAAGCQSTARLNRQVEREIERASARQAVISTGAVAQATAWGDDTAAATVTQVNL